MSSDKPPLQIGLAIREMRERRKISQRQLAERAKISLIHIRKLETQDRGFSAESLTKLSAALEVDESILMLLADPREYGLIGELKNRVRKDLPKNDN